MKLLAPFILFICASLLSACDNKSTESRIENPLAGHQEALEKAKEVENKLHESQQKTLEAIDKESN